LLREIGAQRRNHGRRYGFLAALLADHLLPPGLRDALRRLTGRTTQRPDWLDLRRLGARPGDPADAATRVGGPGINGLSIAQLTAISLPMQLKWADRDSMAHSVESRAPFLDYRLVDYAVSLPAEYKLRDGVTKRVLRAAMGGILPRVIVERRDKMGFVTPEELWVRRDRPERFRVALRDAVAAAGGVLTPHALEIGAAMIDGRLPYHNRLWRMICFGQWMRRFQVEIGP
jgi:asparagine synthase (glutamine-hydrolysing)